MVEALKRVAPWIKLRDVGGLQQPTSPNVYSENIIPVFVINDDTYPVETDAGAPDVTDRAARLVGVTYPGFPFPTSAQTDISVAQYNSVTNGDFLTIAAPGASKNIYLTSITFCDQTATAMDFYLKYAATIKMTWKVSANSNYTMAFPTPLKVDANTSVVFNEASANNKSIVVTGWSQ